MEEDISSLIKRNERELYLQYKYFSKFKKNLYGKYLLKFGLRRDTLLKFKEKKLEELIQRKGMILLSQKFLKECQIPISPKIFLFSFLVNRYPIYVNNDKFLIFLSEKVVNSFQSPVSCEVELKKYLLSFDFFLKKYKERDCIENVKNLSVELINLVKGKKIMEGIEESKEKNEYLLFNEKFQIKIKEECSRIYSINIEEYINSSEELRKMMENASSTSVEKILDEEYDSLSKKINITLKKLYWDNLSKEISLSNFDGMEKLILEIKNSFLDYFSENESRKIEIEDIFYSIKFDKTSISSVCKYIFLLLSEMKKEFLEETFLIFNIIEEMIHIEDNTSILLPSIMCLITERLERYSLINK